MKSFVPCAIWAVLVAFAVLGGVPTVSSKATLSDLAEASGQKLENEVGKVVDTLKNLRSQFETGNLPLTLAPGAPGGSSDIAKFLAKLWRGSRREGGLWFAHLDTDGWVGYYDGANADDKTYTFLQKSTTGTTYGDRLFYKYDAALSPGGMPTKTLTNFNYKGKSWFAESGCANYTTNAGACKPAWVAQISATSGKLNYYYTVPTSYEGSLFGIGLSGRTVNADFANALSQFNSSEVQVFVAYKKTGYLARSDGKPSVNMVSNALYGKTDTGNNQNDVYAAFVDRSAGNTTSATVNGVAWTPTIIDLPMGENSPLTIVVASKDGNCNSACRGNVANGAKAAMKNLLNPLVNDMNALKAECASGSIPRTYPNEVPGAYQRIQRYYSAAWQANYKVGGLWMGTKADGYIGYAAGQGDQKMKVSQYTYIPPKPWNVNCSAIPSTFCTGDNCAAVTNGQCRRFYPTDASGNEMPSPEPYRQIDSYVSSQKGWYTGAATAKKITWSFLYGTTTKKPGANIAIPIMNAADEVVAVGLAQMDLGFGSVIAKKLAKFVGDDLGLTVLIVNRNDGQVYASSGSEKDYYKKENGNLVLTKMKDFDATNAAIGNGSKLSATSVHRLFGLPSFNFVGTAD